MTDRLNPNDPDADAGVVESRVQMERLIAEGLLAGREIQGFSAKGMGLRSADLDGVTIERLDLQDADCDRARLETAQLRAVDLRRARFADGLWNRVHAHQCDLTEIDLVGALIADCRFTTLRLGRAKFHRAKISRTTFHDVELYSAHFTEAVLTKVSFEAGEAGAVSSVSRASFEGAALIEVDLRQANCYGTIFKRALLVRCDLRGANLCDADFRGARLVGCETGGADIDGAKIE